MPGQGTHLHGDETVIDHDLLGEAEEKGSWIMRSAGRSQARDEKDGQVCAYCCLVLVIEAFIDVLVHQRRLADAAGVDAAKMSVSASTEAGVLPEITRSSRYIPTVAENDNLGGPE